MTLSKATLHSAYIVDVLSAQKGDDRRANIIDDLDVLEATNDLFLDVARRAQKKLGWVVARSMIRPLAGHPTLGELVVSVGTTQEGEEKR